MTSKADSKSVAASGSSSGASTSRSLLLHLRNGEPDAWDRLVTLYAPLACYWCRKYGVAEQDLGDVVQEVFHSVSTRISRFRNDRAGDTFRGWLHTIAKSKSMDHFRRRVKQTDAVGGSDALRMLQQFPADGPTDDVVDAPAYHDLFLRACDLIRTDFHETTWKAFWRVVVDEQSPKDVADELSMKPGTVRVAKSRVLQRLRQELGELPE